MEKPFFAKDLLFRPRRRRNNCDLFQNDVRLFQNKLPEWFQNQSRTRWKDLLQGLHASRLSSWQAPSRTISQTRNSFQEARGDVTKGVTRWCLRSSVVILAEKVTTWPATQVCLRTVESGLGGHDACVWGVDEGVENASLPITKRGRLWLSDYPTFSDFVGVVNDFGSESRNDIGASVSSFKMRQYILYSFIACGDGSPKQHKIGPAESQQ